MRCMYFITFSVWSSDAAHWLFSIPANLPPQKGIWYPTYFICSLFNGDFQQFRLRNVELKDDKWIGKHFEGIYRGLI